MFNFFKSFHPKEQISKSRLQNFETVQEGGLRSSWF